MINGSDIGGQCNQIGEISPICQKFGKGSSSVQQITNLLWRIPFAFGPIFIFAIFIISKNNLSFWSHCYRPTMQKPLNYYYLLVNSLKVVFAQPQQQQRRRQPNIQGAFYGVPFIHSCRYQCCSIRRQTVSGKTPPGFNVCIKLLQQL